MNHLFLQLALTDSAIHNGPSGYIVQHSRSAAACQAGYAQAPVHAFLQIAKRFVAQRAGVQQQVAVVGGDDGSGYPFPLF
jgi:hypothetical protein